METATIRKYWERATPMAFGHEQWTWQQKREFRYKLQDYMQPFFTGVKGLKVLEVGCGSGIDAVEFAINGASVTAIDITKNAVAKTKELAKEADVKIRVAEYDGENIPFASEQFDMVYSYGVLHHCPNAKDLVSEIHRVIKPNGKVLAMVYNRNSLLFTHSILGKFASRENWLQTNETGLIYMASKYSERIEDCPYTKCYSEKEARELFREFRDVEVDTEYNVIDTERERKVKIQCPKELGWHLIIKGIK